MPPSLTPPAPRILRPPDRQPFWRRPVQYLPAQPLPSGPVLSLDPQPFDFVAEACYEIERPRPRPARAKGQGSGAKRQPLHSSGLPFPLDFVGCGDTVGSPFGYLAQPGGEISED
jgi:hypothetical protein